MNEVLYVLYGALSSGRRWHVVDCAKPDNGIKEGKHLILEGIGQPRPEDITLPELIEFRALAFSLAEGLAIEPGRWRVDANGPKIATRSHLHFHIKLPAGSDKLARLVGE